MHHFEQNRAQIDRNQERRQYNDKTSDNIKSTMNTLANTRTWALDSRNSLSTNMERPFDVIIFAASGSVGKFLVEELALVVDKYCTSLNSSKSVSLLGSTKNSQRADNELPSAQRDPKQFAQQTNIINTRRQSVPKQMNEIKWAIAGRSAMKLSETLCRAELSTGIRDLSTGISVILADLNHHKSLLDMCQKTQLIINCAGPYSESAESLIKACLECGTNYIDLAHETTFIDLIRQKYSIKAKQANVFIIQGCGFQAMSAEMGLNFTKQVADGQVREVKIILSLSDSSAHIGFNNSTSIDQSSKSWSTSICNRFSASTGNKTCGIVTLGMWQSLIHEKSQEISLETRLQAEKQASHQDRPKYTRSTSVPTITEVDEEDDDENINHDRMMKKSKQIPDISEGLISPRRHHHKLERKDTQTLVADTVQFRNRNCLAWLQLFQGFTQNGRGYCCPIDSLTGDESQLIRNEMINYELRRPDLESELGWRPIRCTSFMSMKSLLEICFTLVWIMLFNILVKWPPIRLLMRNFPTIFSLGYVNSHKRELERDSLVHLKFCQTFIAYGQPNDESGDPLEQREKHTLRKEVQLLVSRIVGPEPNHIATATYAIQAAMALLLERDHIPTSGGILTPGAAFSDTNIIYQLKRRNIKFEVLKKA